MRTLLLALCLFAFGGCSYDRFPEPTPPTEEPQANTTVAELHRYAGKGEITEPLVVEMTVTSSDSAGNFYKELYVEDRSGALKLIFGVYDIFGIYGRGACVRLLAEGLAVAEEGGGLVVGVASGSAVVPLGPETLIRKHLRIVAGFSDDPWRLVASDLNSQYVGRYVEIVGEFVVGFWTENAVFRDSYGGAIYVYTSKYAQFYGKLLPAGRVRLRGIVVQNGSRLEVRVSDPNDGARAVFP